MKLSLKNKFLVLFLGILVILILGFFQNGIKNFFCLKSQSTQKELWRRGDAFSDFFEGIFQGKKFKEENERLKERNQELLTENVSLYRFKDENEVLREALNVELGREFHLVLADLLSKDVSGDFILISKGIKDGLLVGMPVVNKQKVVLGKIIEVSDRFSRVILVSNKETFFPVKIENLEVTAIVRGKGNSRLSLEEVPQEKEIEKGDIVITSALGGDFPAGLLIGEIGNIEQSDVETFQKAEVVPFFKIEELENVFVITNF